MTASQALGKQEGGFPLRQTRCGRGRARRIAVDLVAGGSSRASRRPAPSQRAAGADLPASTLPGGALGMATLPAARAWLAEGLAPNSLAARIATALMLGAWEGNLPMMELFLSRGADINMANANGEQA